MLFCDGGDDSKAKPAPFDLANVIPTLKGGGEALQFCRVDASAKIINMDLSLNGIRLNGNHGLSSIFEGIIHQV